MITKVTSFTAHQTPEGMRLSFTYSLIDEGGNLMKSNERYTVIVLDDEVNEMIADINTWLLGKVPNQ